jgi:periplasmic protein TonB
LGTKSIDEERLEHTQIDPDRGGNNSTEGTMSSSDNAPRFKIGGRAGFDNFASNLREYFKRGPKVVRDADVSRMTVAWQPWHRTLWQNLRDAIAPPQLAPLKVTSKPVSVPEIWSRDKALAPSQGISLAVHVALIVALVVPLVHHVVSGTPPAVQAFGPLVYSPNILGMPAGNRAPMGGGSGGDSDPIPASEGRLPEFSSMQMAPPMAVLKNVDPEMAVAPTVIGPPEAMLQSPPFLNFGDPTAPSVTDSNGPGAGAGIGNNKGHGVGDGNGDGVGRGSDAGFGGGNDYLHGGHLSAFATCIYCPSPQFTEEARQAKYQGTVTLQVMITAEGRGTQIQVVRGLEMGLSEQAVKAVEGWLFRPARGPDGKPVATVADIEVTFRLL